MIAIIKYNAGNTKSVQNAIERLGYKAIVTDDPLQISKADKVILPGVGQAESAMAYLKAKGLDKAIMSLNQPVLGICLGLQLMCSHTQEGNTTGLGIFDNEVLRFPPLNLVPHMGWNLIADTSNRLFDSFAPDDHLYFVHSYYASLSEKTIATCDYILPFSAALQKDNFYAVQFHPEKSGAVGEKLLKNFLML